MRVLNERFPKKKRIILYTLLVFLILSSIFLCLFYLIQSADIRGEQAVAKNEVTSLFDSEKNIVTQTINQLVTDTYVIQDSLHFSEADHYRRDVMTKFWLSFSNRKEIYDQIRLMDTNGNELVRVDYDNSKAVLAPSNKLQNKKNRRYFQETIQLKPDQLFISKLDLNVENNVVEQPINPVLRLSAPVFSTAGQVEGIVVMNYLADHMLQQLRSVAHSEHRDIFLLNTDGYYLLNSIHPEKEWAFMYPDRSGESFASEYPAEWSDVQKNTTNYLVSSNGLFFFSRVFVCADFSLEHPDQSLILDSGDWYIVTFSPEGTKDAQLFTSSLKQILWNVFRNDYYVFIIILFLSFFISILLYTNREKKEQLQFYSEYDLMTGVYNRRAVFEKLDVMRKKQKECDYNVCICFIDINGLKEVNDVLGHESGDELIRSIAEGINRHVRNGDLLSRVGGDEFLMIFNNIGLDACEAVWDRIKQGYELINQTEHRPYIISASHGIVAMNCSEQNKIDDYINSADEKMYEEKRRIKQNLKVIRED